MENSFNLIEFQRERERVKPLEESILKALNKEFKSLLKTTCVMNGDGIRFYSEIQLPNLKLVAQLIPSATKLIFKLETESDLIIIPRDVNRPHIEIKVEYQNGIPNPNKSYDYNVPFIKSQVELNEVLTQLSNFIGITYNMLEKI